MRELAKNDISGFRISPRFYTLDFIDGEEYLTSWPNEFPSQEDSFEAIPRNRKTRFPPRIEIRSLALDKVIRSSSPLIESESYQKGRTFNCDQNLC